MTKQIGQYKILSELGVGGMGVVYRALDVVLEREVALKRLRGEFATSPTVVSRFRAEAKIQARLSHPNIAHLYTLVEDGEDLCIAMELVEGKALSRYMPMSWQKALPVILQTLDALDYAHSRGVLHRDIKPENIVIDHRGTIKIMDFGIAHALGSARLTREKSIIGTLEYTSPERICGKDVDHRSDIYSVGILLFEMLSGRLPFLAETEYDLLRQHVEAEAPGVSQFSAGVPDWLDAVILKAMAKSPEARYESSAEMASALRAGCQIEATTLQSVATALEIKHPDAKPPSVTEVDRWCSRIEALFEHGDLTFAERLAETALNDFPDSVEIARWRDRCRQATERESRPDSRAGLPYSELSEDEGLRQTLLRILGAEATGDIAEALAMAQSALESRPERTAFELATVYLQSKLSASGGEKER